VNALIQQFLDLLATRGLAIVALASFIENLAGVGTYFPGAIVLLAAMLGTAGKPSVAFVTYMCVVIPAIAANLLSYQIGRYTRPSLQSRVASPPRLFYWYASTYWHPQLAGLTAMAAGGAGIPVLQHVKMFLPISMGWSVIWGVSLYQVGNRVPRNMPEWLTLIFYLYLVLWLLWGVRRYYLATAALKQRGSAAQ